MEDILIINKINRMIREMSKSGEVSIISKYCVNAALQMKARNSLNINLLMSSIPTYFSMQCSLALKSKKRGILGWVMTTINSKYTYGLTRKETISKRELFDTEDDAKAALMEAVK